jgi:hypothetical protein
MRKEIEREPKFFDLFRKQENRESYGSQYSGIFLHTDFNFYIIYIWLIHHCQFCVENVLFFPHMLLKISTILMTITKKHIVLPGNPDLMNY